MALIIISRIAKLTCIWKSFMNIIGLRVNYARQLFQLNTTEIAVVWPLIVGIVAKIGGDEPQ